MLPQYLLFDSYVLYYKDEIKLSVKPNELLLSLSDELIRGWSYFNDQNGEGQGVVII